MNELLDPHNQNDAELSLRPQFLNQYIGQVAFKEQLKVYIEAARLREEALDHVLLYGPPGLGKTTLAYVIANELGVHIKTASGPAIEKPGDLVSLLNDLEPGDVLFIDEIHRMPMFVEEVLYSAMEDYFIDIVIGERDNPRSVRFDLPPFTLIGATTRSGMLSAPLRDRFGIVGHLEYYNIEELSAIVRRTAEIFNVDISAEAAKSLALRSRGTPRIANRLLKRVRDFALVKGNGEVTTDLVDLTLEHLGVDEAGLDRTDRAILRVMIEDYAGRAVGAKSIALAIGEEAETIEAVYEPYLIQQGFVLRTQNGRVPSEKAYKHLGVAKND
ncbi:MAG: Holliday junction branch migration DNA helicase RuvB [Lactobacillales bacterium]|jgi:Holliday junction DNA helicase RuvB|nr:Holliday junction branch migration DNA helicase RuvB [Lactobacillales bacterium]